MPSKKALLWWKPLTDRPDDFAFLVDCLRIADGAMSGGENSALAPLPPLEGLAKLVASVNGPIVGQFCIFAFVGVGSVEVSGSRLCSFFFFVCFFFFGWVLGGFVEIVNPGEDTLNPQNYEPSGKILATNAMPFYC